MRIKYAQFVCAETFKWAKWAGNQWRDRRKCVYVRQRSFSPLQHQWLRHVADQVTAQKEPRQVWESYRRLQRRP